MKRTVKAWASMFHNSGRLHRGPNFRNYTHLPISVCRGQAMDYVLTASDPSHLVRVTITYDDGRKPRKSTARKGRKARSA